MPVFSNSIAFVSFLDDEQSSLDLVIVVIVVVFFSTFTYILCSYRMKLVQIGSNLSKLDQTCPNWIKLVQIGSNLFFQPFPSKADCPFIRDVKFANTTDIQTCHVKLDLTCTNWI